MKKKNFMVKSFARNVQVKNHDLRRDYGSPQLYGMLIQQLLGFHADMQYEMAVDLVIFAYQRIANSTGCPSVDFILDVCYTWIATEQGILKPGVKSFLYNH